MSDNFPTKARERDYKREAGGLPANTRMNVFAAKFESYKKRVAQHSLDFFELSRWQSAYEQKMDFVMQMVQEHLSAPTVQFACSNCSFSFYVFEEESEALDGWASALNVTAKPSSAGTSSSPRGKWPRKSGYAFRR